VGWEAGHRGVVTIGMTLHRHGGFALRTGQPVISNHLENEERFRTPELLERYGIRRRHERHPARRGQAVSGAWKSTAGSSTNSSRDDIAFLQGAANLLGMAIERAALRTEASRHALERQQVLLKEITHRVKNSLAIVASMLKLQASEVNDPAVIRSSKKQPIASRRVAKAHETHPIRPTVRTSSISAAMSRTVAKI